MNPNDKIVPESKYWVTHESNPVREILHWKKVIKEHTIPDLKNNQLDSDEIRNFTTSLLMCIPLTSVFNPRGENSHCPLSKQMQEWREKYDLVGVCEDIISKCSRSTAKQLYSHVYQESDRYILHWSVQNYLYRAYSNYYGRGQPHRAIVSSKKKS